MNENSTKVKFRVASEKTDEELLAFKRAIQNALGIKKNPADDDVPKKESQQVPKRKKAQENNDNPPILLVSNAVVARNERKIII